MRTSLSYGEIIEFDLYYVDNWPAWMDLSMLINSFPPAVFTRGAC